MAPPQSLASIFYGPALPSGPAFAATALTLAAAAVHDAQVGVSAAACGAQFALVPVGGAVRAADLRARGEPLTVGRALAVRTALQHAARLAGAALHSVARI